MFHGLIRFDDERDPSQRTAIVIWPVDNAPPLPPWTRGHIGNGEIILLWTASARVGGNVALCAHDSSAIQHLVRAHLVCEIVYSKDTQWWTLALIDLG